VENGKARQDHGAARSADRAGDRQSWGAKDKLAVGV